MEEEGKEETPPSRPRVPREHTEHRSYPQAPPPRGTRRTVGAHPAGGPGEGAAWHRARCGRTPAGIAAAWAWRAQRKSQPEKCVRNKMFPLVRKPLHFSFSTATTTKISFLWRVIRFLGLSTVASPIYKFGGKSVGRRFLFLLFQPLIVLQWDCQLLYYQPNCFRKKRIIKRISLKGLFSRLGELKLNLPAVFWFAARACT